MKSIVIGDSPLSRTAMVVRDPVSSFQLREQDSIYSCVLNSTYGREVDQIQYQLIESAKASLAIPAGLLYAIDVHISRNRRLLDLLAVIAAIVGILGIVTALVMTPAHELRAFLPF